MELFSLFIPILNNAAVLLVLVTDKFTESMYILANEPSVALYRLQEHVRRSLPELAQHKVRSSLGQESRAGKEQSTSCHSPHDTGTLCQSFLTL